MALMLILIMEGVNRRGENEPLKIPRGKRDCWSRGFPDRSFDIEFWQPQGDEAIFAAAWEMVELAEEIKHGSKYS